LFLRIHILSLFALIAAILLIKQYKRVTSNIYKKRQSEREKEEWIGLKLNHCWKIVKIE